MTTAGFDFQGKAGVLARLRGLVRRSVIGDQVTFTVAMWREDRDEVLRRVQGRFGGARLAVRSSARQEDIWATSGAGRFRSVLDVPGDDRDLTAAAIEAVVASYAGGGPDDEVLVQASLGAVAMSGVVLTRTLGHGAPYYTVNFDDSTSSTETVTSGRGRHLRTVVVHRGSDRSRPPLSPRLGRVLAAVAEIEAVVGHDALDIEFAVSDAETVHILQVRPIAVRPPEGSAPDAAVDRAVTAAMATFRRHQTSGPAVGAGRAYFGVMPDWNPAELIGTKPRRLALSLFRHLITDEVWAIQRAEYGYRDVRPRPLVVEFVGHPYVDIRASFESFIPASVPAALARRLVDDGLEWLATHPHLHDKVEFDVAFTCLDFGFERRAERLRAHGFTAGEVTVLRDSLRAVTTAAFQRCPADLEAIARLDAGFHGILAGDAPPLTRAAQLLEDGRLHGGLAFAHLARSAFIAVALLRSLEAEGITTAAHTAGVLQSVRTVARQFEEDGEAVGTGRLPWETFVARYGHLRPGTFEITRASYGEDPERYLRPMTRRRRPGAGAGTCALDGRIRDDIARGLARLGLPDDVAAFEAFVRASIQAREYAKFMFSRNVSAALAALTRVGEDHGLTRDELSHLALADLLPSAVGAGPSAGRLARGAADGLRRHRVTEALELPPLLLRDWDCVVFERFPAEPNFVTSRRVVGRVIALPDGRAWAGDLSGCVVLIPQADPGFDWLFGHDIAALITMYGGANSHMTIRAAEFGLPAAIGVGEALYGRLAGADLIVLDCGARYVEPVR